MNQSAWKRAFNHFCIFLPQILAEELIRDMIHRDPLQRPTAEDILKHPFFWNAEKILNFLQVLESFVVNILFINRHNNDALLK